MTQSSTVETPSGKGADDENFPVGSFLLPRHLRPHIAKFYAFARTIDDIADNPDLSADEKLRRLDACADAITNGSDDTALTTAQTMRQSLADTGVTHQHCLDLITAFKQDSVKNRYETWDELINYCNHSAAPVGRYLLDLHGDGPAAYPQSDALCNALQVINHLQDCADDLEELDRVYIPQSWLREVNAVTEDLAAGHASPALHSVLTQMTRGADDLLDIASDLPPALNSRRLALESAVIVKIARRLTKRLMTEDPVANRVELGKGETIRCAIAGIMAGLLGRRA